MRRELSPCYLASRSGGVKAFEYLNFTKPLTSRAACLLRLENNKTADALAAIGGFIVFYPLPPWRRGINKEEQKISLYLSDVKKTNYRSTKALIV
jgi:hypothetical protein